jgi:hypothetical protein
MTGALGILMFAFEGPTTSAATTPCIEKKGSQIIGVRAQTHCRRFETGGVPGPTSEMSPRAPAQMGRREAEREGGERWLETDVREVEIPWPSCSSRAQVGCACSRGYKRPRGRGSERPYASACLVLVPARPTLPKRALVLPFIGVRRGSRCTIGGVAECYVSSGGELAP